MKQQTNIKAPQRCILTESRMAPTEFAVICDADGDDLARSRDLSGSPEGNDPEPTTLAAQGEVMVAAPNLLEALDYLLAQTVDMDLKYGVTLTEGEADARAKALSAIAGATGRAA